LKLVRFLTGPAFKLSKNKKKGAKTLSICYQILFENVNIPAVPMVNRASEALYKVGAFTEMLRLPLRPFRALEACSPYFLQAPLSCLFPQLFQPIQVPRRRGNSKSI
jgi:hypothetical protein